ncbi:MAG: class I SAM-dependent methyltransferase [Candidatus Doudnabacteria bacterium]|nr:class I SAM-dependent methyltransferase [Candidatus Doudnabacteria bacterium]
MNHAYNSSETSQAYEQFLASEDGRIFREVIGNAFVYRISSVIPEFSALGKYPESSSKVILDSGSTFAEAMTDMSGAGTTKQIAILDAGCGDGWLVGNITSKQYNNITIRGYGCDAGAPLIAHAQKQYPNAQFTVCDLNTTLPYKPEQFDVVCASMVLHDVADETATLKNFSTVLKPDGRIFASIVNPYYGYPIGEWKRGILRKLLGWKPGLKLARAYNILARQQQPSFEWRPNLGSHFTPLSHHITAAKAAGLVLTSLTDLTSTTDSDTYNLTYQLHRFPIILLLEFSKAWNTNIQIGTNIPMNTNN